jgi:tetratricopeptide (TPR) repeat protein
MESGVVGSDWAAHVKRERKRYEDGLARLPGIVDPDERQRQLTRISNALYGAGLALLMQGRVAEASGSFTEAAARYRESYPTAPAGSWGRPIGATKARILAGDWNGAAGDARWALDEGAAEPESPVGRYAACLALLVLGRHDEAVDLAASLRDRDDFPTPVADALAAIGRRDPAAYQPAIAAVLTSFEERSDYLEEVPVADTVVVLQALAERAGVSVHLHSALLP